jgi:hypothetical protein
LLSHRKADGNIPAIPLRVPLRAFDIPASKDALHRMHRLRSCSLLSTKENTMSDKKQPVAKIDLYPVSASIWANETEKGTLYSITLERTYKDDEGKWQYTASLGQEHALLGAKALDLAHTKIYELRNADRNARAENKSN